MGYIKRFSYLRRRNLAKIKVNRNAYKSGYGPSKLGKKTYPKLKAVKSMSMKKKKLSQRAIKDGQAGSFSRFFYGRRNPNRKVIQTYRALAPRYFVLNSAERLAANAGRQLVHNLFSLFSSSDMGQLFSDSGITLGATARVLMAGASAEIMITNQDQGNVRIVLYDIIQRRDGDHTEVDTPAAAWTNSYGDEGGADTDVNFVGSTPFSSDLFVRYFKVLKMTHILLSQGQTHVHRVHFSPNKIMDGEVIRYASGAVRGITCHTMIQAHGVPYNYGSDTSIVSTGQVNLDVVYKKQYKYKCLQQNALSWNITNSLTGLVNESIMDIGSGVKVTDTPA